MPDIIKNWTLETPNSTAIQFDSIVRIELNKDDEIVQNSKRAEIHAEREKANEEHTYIFYTLLPNGGNEDYLLDPNGSEVIAQWHNAPDVGEDWTSPPLALRTKGNNYYIERYWDTNSLSTNAEMKANNEHELIDLGSYIEDKGHWVKWVFHIKWGWLESQNPILEIYKDDILVVQRNGTANTTNDIIGNCMKLGIYKWDWAQTTLNYSILDKRVIYYRGVDIQ